MAKTSQVTEIIQAMDQATSYAEWLEAAAAHDAATGAEAWRQEEASDHYDAVQMKAERDQLRDLRQRGQGAALAVLLQDSLTRSLGELHTPELYTRALCGTKHLIGAYLDEAEVALRWLAANPVPGVSPADKLARFEQSWRVYGRSALMLSGGATWGFYHLGVVKALFDAGLLPRILSGASTGAMIAAGVCARNDTELAELFADPLQMRLDGLRTVGARQALATGAVLDPAQLDEVLSHNIGEATFAEAFSHSGRALNIVVSPTRTRQKPRLLSHLTAPNVLIAQAAVASSALPGLFPPATLHRRALDGRLEPYGHGERWVDGSLASDLPKRRLARLHNVNHFIVSQTNPYALPFVWHHGQRGVLPTVTGIAASSVRSQGAYAVDLIRRATRPHRGPLGLAVGWAHNLVSQDYRGDIDIHPRFRWALLRKVVGNPTPDELRAFIREGERATWPRLPAIADQTRLGRVFQSVVAQLRDTRAPGATDP